jgi:hypothetical protein
MFPMFCDCHQLAAAGAFALERGTIAGYLFLIPLFLVFSEEAFNPYHCS